MDEESAGAVLHRWSGEEPVYLLLHYQAGHWGLPKGHIEAGEDEVEALVREIHEETGIPPDAVEVLPGFRESTRYRFTRDGRPVDKVVHYHLAETGRERVELSHEHQDWAWLGREDARRRLTYDEVVDVLEAADRVIRGR